MKIQTIFISLILITAFGCSCNTALSTDNYLSWNLSELIGYQYELEDQEIVMDFSFLKENMVAATLGTKDVVTGPILYWKIDEKGKLVISDYKGQPIYHFKKVQSSDNKAVIEWEGKRQTYRKTKLNTQQNN